MKRLCLFGGLAAVLGSACLSDVGGDESTLRDAGRGDAAVEMTDSGSDGEDEPRDASTKPDAGDASAPRDAGAQQPTESFKAIYDEILLPKCATSYCHVATNRGGLNMTSASEAYMRLVNTKAGDRERDPYSLCKESNLIRVVPSDPDASLLIQKLDPPASGVVCGKAMPLNLSPLPAADIARIRRWISQGAANN